jgi:hypothetical protein
MGDAKRRGPYEKRVQQSIARTAIEKEKRRADAQAWWDSLSDTEKMSEKEKAKEKRDARLMLLGIVGLVTPVLS